MGHDVSGHLDHPSWMLVLQRAWARSVPVCVTPGNTWQESLVRCRTWGSKLTLCWGYLGGMAGAEVGADRDPPLGEWLELVNNQ